MWGTNKADTIRFFNLGDNSERFERFFIEHKVPVFVMVGALEVQIRTTTNEAGGKFPVYASGGLILNNNLEDLEFYKIIDPFTAYQELSMYIGGVIALNEPDMVEIDDRNMRNKKGFDECSFKHMPDLRKRKRKTGKLPKKGK